MNPELDVRAFAEIAETLHAAPTPARAAEDVVAYAREQLDADYGGITLLCRGGRLETYLAGPRHRLASAPVGAEGRRARYRQRIGS